MGHVHLKMKVLVISLGFLFINDSCNPKHINSKKVFGEICTIQICASIAIWGWGMHLEYCIR